MKALFSKNLENIKNILALSTLARFTTLHPPHIVKPHTSQN